MVCAIQYITNSTYLQGPRQVAGTCNTIHCKQHIPTKLNTGHWNVQHSIHYKQHVRPETGHQYICSTIHYKQLIPTRLKTGNRYVQHSTLQTAHTCLRQVTSMCNTISYKYFLYSIPTG